MKGALEGIWNGRRALSPQQLGFGIAGLTLILDQISKNWILYGLDLPARYQIPVLPFFKLSMVWNQGVSFGLFSAGSWIGRTILVIFAFAVVGLLIKWLLEAERTLFALAVGLVIGGAVGNALDRLIYGAVVDFLDFSDLYFRWVFNVADAAISIGVVFLVYDGFFAKQVPESSSDSSKDPEEPR